MAKRQTELPGMERKKVAEINKAAEEYVEIRDARMAMTKREVEARGKLEAVMKKHEYNLYEDLEADPPLQVKLEEGKTKVRVKKMDGTEDEAPEAKEEKAAKDEAKN